jgi:hypothetical protein
MSNAAGGWHPDPSGRHQLRYWDGSSWTDHVSDGGVVASDPEGAAPPAAPTQAVFSARPGGDPAPSAFGTPPQDFGSPAGFGTPPQDFGAQAPYGGQPPFGGPPPYGAPAYGAQPMPYGMATGARGESLSALATATMVLLGISGLVSLGFAAALFSRASLLDDPLGASFQELQDADDLAAATAGFFLLSVVVTGILWVIWQFRHARNAEVLGQGGEGLGAGWAIGGWFIPVGNLVIPQLQLFQAAKASDPEAPARRTAPAVLLVWWALYAIGAVLSFLSGRYGGDDVDQFQDIESFQSADRMAAVGALVMAAAAVAGILTVRALTARQHQALRARGQLR